MAFRRVEIGEEVTIRWGIHKGKRGKVVKHERHVTEYRYRYMSRIPSKTLLTYVVEIEGVGTRRLPGSYLDLVKGEAR